MKLTPILFSSGLFLSCFCQVGTYEGIVETKCDPISRAYLIGSKWAITLEDPLKSFQYKELHINIAEDEFGIEYIKMNNYKLPMKNTSINLAQVKLNREADKYGTVLLCPYYPEEGSYLFSIDNQQNPCFEVTTYRLCRQRFGYTDGAFCIRSAAKGKQFPSRGVFYDNMLVGLTAGFEKEGVHLVTAIAPALRWITDTMSEIIYR